MEWARRAQDTRLQAALQLRLADTLERLGDPAAAAIAPVGGRETPGNGTISLRNP
ncbi:hypothetical protein STANM309S_05839 [Streptomyces tanashiensis]